MELSFPMLSVTPSIRLPKDLVLIRHQSKWQIFQHTKHSFNYGQIFKRM